MLKHLKNTCYTFWLGGSLGYAGLSFTDFKFYVVVIPTILLVTFINERTNDVEA